MNAAEASREVAFDRRLVTVRAVTQKDGPRTYAVVEVRDAGVGISDVDLPRLFEAFYSTKAGGLGMGLSISNTIIERHGGRLWVTTNVDYGATFHFSIPAQS
jgi:signal transduction histidine kinase